MNPEIRLRIVLEQPPPGVDFGLQKGSGSNFETIQKQRSNGKDLFFEFTINVKTSKDATKVFTGPIVQGPTGEKFLYIDIGTIAGQINSPWSRRLKIPLKGISSETVQKLLSDTSVMLEASVQGTGKDGSPTCATVKPFSGWKLVEV